jgi:hypothetical protein
MSEMAWLQQLTYHKARNATFPAQCYWPTFNMFVTAARNKTVSSQPAMTRNQRKHLSQEAYVDK